MSLLLLGAPALAVTGGDALLREATAIVEELGPRPVGSRAADDAQAWAFDTLDAAGWRPVRVEGIDGFTVGCRPGASDRIVLFLAHTDSVHEDVPGAVDNAGAMAVLAAVARDLPATEVTPRTVCLAFPDAEEVGLLGSRQLAEQREHYLPGPVDQVMALDLVGRGTLTHNGLGPAWSGSRLRALLHAAPADVPYVYRAISEGRPELERSDHHWFGRAGIPSSHLLSRGESGVLWTYHTSRDTPDTLQPEALAAAYGAVWGVAHAPVLPAGEPIVPPLVVPFTHLVVPGGIVALGLSALLGVAVAGRWGRVSGEGAVLAQVLEVTWIGLTALLGVAGGLVLAAGGRPFGFALAGPVALAGWAGLIAGTATRGTETPLAPTLVTLLQAALAGWMLALGLPLLAVPLLVAAAAAAWIDRVPPLGQIGLGVVASWPALYLVRGDAIRELAHHQMVPAWTPVWTLVLLVLGGPLAAAVARQRWRVRQGLLAGALAVLLATVAWAWATPVMAPPWERPPFYVQPARPPLPPVW